ncbi:MAG: histidine kinase [Bdellovibrionota bacterium]
MDLGISSALWPIFGQIWPMSKILTRIMLTEPLEERCILEVGCGLALPSIVIQQMGGNITASDYHPLAQSFLLENTILNSLAEIPFAAGNWNISLPSPKKFDLIIGSDLLYETSSVELLSSFIDLNLSQQGKVIIIDPGRGSHRTFVRKMEFIGFKSDWTNLQLFSNNNFLQKGFYLQIFTKCLLNFIKL